MDRSIMLWRGGWDRNEWAWEAHGGRERERADRKGGMSNMKNHLQIPHWSWFHLGSFSCMPLIFSTKRSNVWCVVSRRHLTCAFIKRFFTRARWIVDRSSSIQIAFECLTHTGSHEGSSTATQQDREALKTSLTRILRSGPEVVSSSPILSCVYIFHPHFPFCCSVRSLDSPELYCVYIFRSHAAAWIPSFVFFFHLFLQWRVTLCCILLLHPDPRVALSFALARSRSTLIFMLFACLCALCSSGDICALSRLTFQSRSSAFCGVIEQAFFSPSARAQLSFVRVLFERKREFFIHSGERCVVVDRLTNQPNRQAKRAQFFAWCSWSIETFIKEKANKCENLCEIRRILRISFEDIQ